MNNCNECVYKEKAEKIFYCEECSTCTNGENEDTNNNFKSKLNEYINGKSEVCFAAFEDEHYRYAYNQALDDFAKWVNENQMKEFIVEIWISSDGPSCDMNDLVKLFLSK